MAGTTTSPTTTDGSNRNQSTRMLPGAFVTALEEKNAETTPISIFTVQSPKMHNVTRATMMKQFIAITMPLNNLFQVYPKDSNSESDIISNAYQFPTSTTAAAEYMFDEKTITKTINGKRQEYYVTSIRTRCPKSLNEHKSEHRYMTLLKKCNIFVTARSDGPTVSTKTIGYLKNVNPDYSAIASLTNELQALLEPGSVLRLEKHRIAFSHKGKSYVTHVLKVNTDIKIAHSVKRELTLKLKNCDGSIMLDKVELIPLDTNQMSMEVFINHILEHNDYLHSTTTVEIQNVWVAHTEMEIPQELAHQFKFQDEDGMTNDAGKRIMTIREMLFAAFYRCFIDKPPIRDILVRGSKLLVVCEDQHLAEAARFTETFFEMINDILGANVVAKACGCNHPDDEEKHPRICSVTGYGKTGLYRINYKKEMEYDIQGIAGVKGIIDEKNNMPLTAIDRTKPPSSSYRKTGREPTETDPSHLREGAAETWKQFAEELIKSNSTAPKKKTVTRPPAATIVSTPPPQNEETRNEISALQTAMKEMKESQQKQDSSAASLSHTVTILEATMTTMAEAITMNNASLTDMNGKFDALNRQLATLTKIITQHILQKNSNKDNESIEDITDTLMHGGDLSPRAEAVKHTLDGDDVLSYPNILHDSTQYEANQRVGRDPPTFPTSISASPGLSYSPHSSQNPNAGQSSSSSGFGAGV